jgi:hypothetical protein
MPLNQAKYVVELIDGTRCRVIELPMKSDQFLKDLLSLIIMR